MLLSFQENNNNNDIFPSRSKNSWNSHIKSPKPHQNDNILVKGKSSPTINLAFRKRKQTTTPQKFREINNSVKYPKQITPTTATLRRSDKSSTEYHPRTLKHSDNFFQWLLRLF